MATIVRPESAIALSFVMTASAMKESRPAREGRKEADMRERETEGSKMAEKNSDEEIVAKVDG